MARAAPTVVLRRGAWLAACLVLCLGRLASAAPGVAFQTSVAPEPDDDLAAPCGYELTLLDPSRPVRGVWVIFDRGRDMLRYYGDPDVQAFAQQHDFALLLAFHCRAKSDPDINADPAKGLGRALFAALAQFAERSKHPELASTNVIALGFSGTGVLAARLAAFAPERMLAVIPTDAGQGDPLGVDTIDLPSAAASIPHFVVAGGADAVSGTERPYAYFRRHFDKGAPWTFVVQNRTPHCCIINVKHLILEWLKSAVVERRRRGSGMYGFIRTSPSDLDDCPDPRPVLVPPYCRSTKDTWGGSNWSVSGASVNRRGATPRDMMPAGWMPTRAFARRWAAFVAQPEHPVTSLP